MPAAEPALAHADELIARSRKPVTYTIDPALGHAEAFSIDAAAGRITAGGPGGVLYGVQELVGDAGVVGAEGVPDFAVRGAVLVMLSPSWNYQSDLSPEIYPWFFDRPLMTRYLDHLLAARLNTLVLWSGHLFPHILELPEYPDASQFSREEIRRNQEQFRWLAGECAKRNISVLTHFYNIHISEHQAAKLGRTGPEAARYAEPDDWVRGYYRTILARYFAEFANVGLYICPGESLEPKHQLAWFRDVVFAAARASGKNPRLIIRDWTLDPEFKAALPSLYDNLASELKHNDETITSPWPDLKHRTWKGVLHGGHIINLHDPADAVPYRLGSPALFGEMVRRWKDEGYITGAWWYPPHGWTWPATLDIVEPAADGAPRELLTLDRDEIWHLLEGRLLWRAHRDAAAERTWAAGWLGRKFAGPAIGDHLVDWYDLTGPILPGLQNVTAVRFGNFFPTSIAWVQATVDDILSFRTRIDDEPVRGTTGLTKQRYYSQPVDEFTIGRYRARYSLPAELAERRSMPVAQVAAELAAGRDPRDVLRADLLVDLYLEMARDALARAEAAAALGGDDAEELRRFVQDSRCLILTAEYYRLKVRAALEKRLLELTGGTQHADSLRAHMEASVAKYEELLITARLWYRKGTSMWDAKPWERCLEEKVKPDRDRQLQWLAERAAR
ncbi:MAG: hypothetical protein IAE82_05240 [Opitutaceae bacterium]|nr:hypothetical protein [Opitutaceae bacterium]